MSDEVNGDDVVDETAIRLARLEVTVARDRVPGAGCKLETRLTVTRLMDKGRVRVWTSSRWVNEKVQVVWPRTPEPAKNCFGSASLAMNDSG
jgi:hypothetical protein